MKKLFLLSALLMSSFWCVQAQLGFCNGSKGDPIFHEDFGTGNGTGSELDGGITNYIFVTQDPQDGEYTISSDIGNTITSWHSYLPANSVSGGRALIVNADFTPGRFYRKEVSGLCENTTYEFSAFLMNVYDRGSNICPNGGIPNNVKFEIWDETDTILIKSGDTGNINSTTNPVWEQYALTFQSEVGQDAVILKMYNNSNGGCGNDLAIDDVIFRSCGDLTSVTSSENDDTSLEICEENSPVQLLLQANSDNSVYEEHFYQWQKSNNLEEWTDIPGANAETYQSLPLSATTFFRVKVAEDAANLSSNECSSASEVFKLEIIQQPEAPASSGDKKVCSNEKIPLLRVIAAQDEIVNWYDAETGGNLLAENTSSFLPETAGIYYAEAKKASYDCFGSLRTKVTLVIYDIPQPQDEVLEICPDANLFLDAGESGYFYNWSTGENSKTIQVNSPGNYSVEISSSEGCSSTKNFQINPVKDASIDKIISENESVLIKPVTEGDFLYSLDGTNFQEAGSFTNLSGGIYTAFIKDKQGCKIDKKEFAHMVMPLFISPNGDGYNDTFELKGIEFFENSKIQIFDRYGKVLKSGKGAGFQWNGTYDGQDLPADDYWYVISISGYKEKKGHFSIIR